MTAIKIDPLPVSRFFTPEGDSRRRQIKDFPQCGSLDRSMSHGPDAKRRSVDNEKWEADRLTAFSHAQLAWPPEFSPEFAEKTSHLGRRACEVVWYWERVCSPEQLVNAYVDIHMGINFGRGLVQGLVPCIARSSRIWCFDRSVESDDTPAHHGGGIEMAGCELLALQGFSLQSQSSTLAVSTSPADRKQA